MSRRLFHNLRLLFLPIIAISSSHPALASDDLPPELANSKSIHLTLKTGSPIGDKSNSLTVGAQGPQVIYDVAYFEETAHFNRERIPERVVHAKGAGAFGTFTVTSNKIRDYSKAKLFADKVTPVAIRISHVVGESAIPDTTRDVRGFAVKFYSSEGNWDLVGNNVPVFFIRDPINFVSFVHSQKRDPATHVKSPDSFWDYISLKPETLHATMWLFSKYGIPKGFRRMDGWGVNTFKLVNQQGKAFYARFKWQSQQGYEYCNQTEADHLAGAHPDFALEDFYNSIMSRKREMYPRWKFQFQVMPIEAVAKNLSFNPFDVTKLWPEAEYPWQNIGEMVLDENPRDYFSQVEQIAFSPANLVPGIEASPDRILMGRILAYADAQRYRLGANFADLPQNRPHCPFMSPTYRDGAGTVKTNSKLPNYVPNFKFPDLGNRAKQYVEHEQNIQGLIGRFEQPADKDYEAASDFISGLSKPDYAELVANLASHLSGVTYPEIKQRVLNQLKRVDVDFGKLVKERLSKH